MVYIPEQRRRVVLNPGGGPLKIDDIDAFMAPYEQGGARGDEEPMVDLGGGMEVPLRELLDTLDGDDEED
jgi:hypothetical protein